MCFLIEGSRDRRIWKHPILEFHRGKKIKFYFEGSELEAFENETIAVALYANGVDILSWSETGRPRGAFCMIGKCSSCFMIVDGIPNVRTCRELVKPGIRVERQKGLPEIPSLHSVISKEERKQERIETDLLVIGGGPGGLAAALAAAKYGLQVVLVDGYHKLGGQLLKQTHKFFGSKDLFGGLRGFQIAELLSKEVNKNENIRILTGTIAYGIFRDRIVGLASKDNNKLYQVKAKNIIISTGAQENYLAFPGNDLPGVMGAGGAQTLMNEFGILPGRDILVVGSGNVGLIVSYQLLQAGANVKGIVEIMPHIGGWFVHAAKIRRYGIPIYIRHTISEVWGNGRVEGATIIKVDEKWKPILGTEKKIKCDMLLLAVGLTPDSALLMQAGAKMAWIPELGGFVAYRTKYNETTVPNVFVVGDASGIEEATTAMIEGKISGLTAVLKTRGKIQEVIKERERFVEYLENYRKSPVLERARIGHEKALIKQTVGEML